MQSRSIDRVTLLNITIFVEAFLLLSATFWSHVAGVQLLPQLRIDTTNMLIGAGCGVGIAACSFFMLWLGKYVRLLGALRDITLQQIAPLFGDLTLFDLLAVAVLSGFCEEVLFRGVMQNQFGIWATSLIFALFHCPNLKFLSYGIWVFSAGIFLGWLALQTGSLWTPVLAHATSNCLSLLFLRYVAKMQQQEQPTNSNPDE
jgi:membrane protease YdiL (CAAX protease family)